MYFKEITFYDAYDFYKKREIELVDRAKLNGNKLKRSDVWRLNYYKKPYLLLQSNEVILDRFTDVLSNTHEISSEGKIFLTGMSKNGPNFYALQTEVLEETNWRGVLSKNSMVGRTRDLNEYFLEGNPPGMKMFNSQTKFKRDWLIKFSQRQFIDEMYKFGRIRVCPASYYSKGSHIKAVKDFETTRKFNLTAIDEALKGYQEISFCGVNLKIVNGVVPLNYKLDDYYLYCLCSEISRRMPTDFEADAALVIKNKPKFLKRFKTAILKKLYDWEFNESNVYYYDPFKDIPQNNQLEFWKHLSYAYQKEHRCVVKPTTKGYRETKLSPIFLELGSLSDISEVVYSC